MISHLFLCIVLSGLVTAEEEIGYDINHANLKFSGYERVRGSVAGTVTVHVVPHTHDDVGWLKTVDQYYYGSKDDIYKGGVQYIIDTVVEELYTHPEKTFIYVEIAYFKRWWEEQDKEMKTKVKKLITNKQLEFANGGYCMNDEGSVHYAATIDQMSAGLVWLEETFGGVAEPTIAWQIDAFGHSSAQAALSAQMGLKGMFFARMHYQDYDKRKANKDLEYSWYVEDDSIFTGVLYRNYNAPPGFCFDRSCTDPPMVTDPRSPEYNLPERVASFVKYLNEQASHYRSGNIMLPMGGNFCYQNAHKYFKNLDILMKNVNANSTNNGFKMVYSTPSRYMNAVLKSIGGDLTNTTDDLFPYADGPHSYWTGYFTSRPTLKGYIRDCNNVLQTCRQIEVLIGAKTCYADTLWLAMGIAQHHNAVSGTSKQHVADDYSRRLAAGQTDCENVINRGLEKLSSLREGQLESCRLANESYCAITRRHGNNSLTVVVYNARTIGRAEYIRIPLLHSHYELIDLATNKAMVLTFVDVNPALRRINPDALPLEGVFRASLPPMGFSSYQLQITPYPSQVLKHHHRARSDDIRIESQVYVVVFDGETGSMKSITNKLTGVSGMTDKLSARFMEYSSSTGDSLDKQPSGAYIFRPLNDRPDDIGNPVLTSYVVSEQFSEIWQTYSDWINLVTRVYLDKFYIEIEWVVGPIPLDHGREVILRYDTSLATNKTFYTDSNGREMIQRILNKQQTWDLNVTEPIAGNYYPVNTRAILVDEERDMQLTVLTDRSQGGASLADGQVELMVHRRILKDDYRGVDEPLNETQFGHGLIAKGRHWLFYSSVESIGLNRVIGLDLFYRPTVAIGLDEVPEYPNKSFSDSAVDNEYINLLTVLNVDYTGDVFTYLLRLENIIPANEGGQPITVDLERVFKGKTLVDFEEKALAGDRPISHVKLDMTQHTLYDVGNQITLQPLQIRTFFATYKPRESSNSTEESGNSTEESGDSTEESGNSTEESGNSTEDGYFFKFLKLLNAFR